MVYLAPFAVADSHTEGTPEPSRTCGPVRKHHDTIRDQRPHPASYRSSPFGRTTAFGRLTCAPSRDVSHTAVRTACRRTDRYAVTDTGIEVLRDGFRKRSIAVGAVPRT